MTTTIPETMKRLVLKAPGQDLKSCVIEVEERPVPIPQAGEVLIKVAAAPVNPADCLRWSSCKPEDCPVGMGYEGSGIVVGGDFEGSDLSVGDKVGFFGLTDRQGSYSEYVAIDPKMGTVYRMPADLAIEDAASFYVNPFTAIGILDTVRSAGGKAFVHTAAASQLGQMIVKLSAQEGIEVINVVVREDQAELLRSLGAKHIVVTENNHSWKGQLVAKMRELDASIAMDAIAGTMTADLLPLLPPRLGAVYVYGALGGAMQNVMPVDLIYCEKRIMGFILHGWVKRQGAEKLQTTCAKVVEGLKSGGWSTSQFKDVSMEKMQEEMTTLLEGRRTGVKLRLRFDVQ